MKRFNPSLRSIIAGCDWIADDDNELCPIGIAVGDGRAFNHERIDFKRDVFLEINGTKITIDEARVVVRELELAIQIAEETQSALNNRSDK